MRTNNKLVIAFDPDEKELGVDYFSEIILGDRGVDKINQQLFELLNYWKVFDMGREGILSIKYFHALDYHASYSAHLPCGLNSEQLFDRITYLFTPSIVALEELEEDKEEHKGRRIYIPNHDKEGDRILWIGDNKIVGFMQNRPDYNDRIFDRDPNAGAEMLYIYRIVHMKWYDDPEDMFIADVQGAGCLVESPEYTRMEYE